MSDHAVSGSDVGDRRGRCAIAVMAKQSTPGRTKTRLIPHVGPDVAAALNTAFLKDVTANLEAAAALTPIDTFMAFAPAGAEPFFRTNLPKHVGLVEAVAPTLGGCLFRAMETLLLRGYGRVCLLNADSPTLPPANLVAASVALAAGGDRVVLGPAVDGGYYLIGLKSAHRRLFEDIDWSTDVVFEQTVQRAAELRLPVVQLPSWYDVDELETLQTLAGELFGGRPFRDFDGDRKKTGGEHTRAILSPLLETPRTRALLLGSDTDHAEVA